MTLINNKVKQFVKGNWGKPASLEQGLKLRHLDIEPQHIRGKKKKHKWKREYVYEGFCCPFCHRELPEDESKKTCRYVFNRATACPKCKAFEVKECPACKRNTWYWQGWYKHQGRLGCGFEGKKLARHL